MMSCLFYVFWILPGLFVFTDAQFRPDDWPCSVPFPCVEFEKYGDSEDCAYYYECLHGEPLHQPCQDTLNFDIYSKDCDWPVDVTCQPPCPTLEAPNGTMESFTIPAPGEECYNIGSPTHAVGFHYEIYECSSEWPCSVPTYCSNGKRYGDPDDCRVFHLCIAGILTCDTCPERQFFDVDLDFCSYYTESLQCQEECEEDEIINGTAQPKETGPCANHIEMCANEDFNITYYPDQGYCEFYWECIDGNLTTQHQCTESGHVFNMAAQQCSYMNDLINCDNPCNYDQDSSTSSTDVPKTSTSSAPTGSTTSTTPGPDTTSKPEDDEGSDAWIIIVIVLVVILVVGAVVGLVYYFKVKRNKLNQSTDSAKEAIEDGECVSVHSLEAFEYPADKFDENVPPMERQRHSFVNGGRGTIKDGTVPVERLMFLPGMTSSIRTSIPARATVKNPQTSLQLGGISEEEEESNFGNIQDLYSVPNKTVSKMRFGIENPGYSLDSIPESSDYDNVKIAPPDNKLDISNPDNKLTMNEGGKAWSEQFDANTDDNYLY